MSAALLAIAAVVGTALFLANALPAPATHIRSVATPIATPIATPNANPPWMTPIIAPRPRTAQEWWLPRRGGIYGAAAF